MSTKHTPGPWESTLGASGCQAVEAEDGTVVASYVSEANARLIASAPDLLEALESLVANLAEGDFISETRIDAARAAIAKAAGEVK